MTLKAASCAISDIAAHAGATDRMRRAGAATEETFDDGSVVRTCMATAFVAGDIVRNKFHFFSEEVFKEYLK